MTKTFAVLAFAAALPALAEAPAPKPVNEFNMMWTKQFYNYDVDQWLTERGADPFRKNRRAAAPRNGRWHHMSGQASLWSVVTGSEPAERKALGLSFAFFFFVLTSYYLLRPLREQFSAAVGSTNLWPFWLATLVATLVFTPFFGALVSRFSREKFIPVVYAFFIVCLLAFVPAFRAEAQIGPRVLGTVFYVWVSVFNLFVVSLFWSFMRQTSSQGPSMKACSSAVSTGLGCDSSAAHFGAPENSSPSKPTVPASSATRSVSDSGGRIFV